MWRGDIYYGAEADEPGWALLNTADIGASMRLVPVEDDDEEPLEGPDAFVARGGRWPAQR